MASTQTSYSSFNMFQPKIQPRSSAERDNSHLLHSVLKAASTDIAHQLLDYASLDKVDCEASCILIALSNHEPTSSTSHDSKPKKNIKEQAMMIQEEKTKDKEAAVMIITEKKQQDSVEKPSTKDLKAEKVTMDRSKTDPIMLLMAAAKVIDGKDYSNNHFEKRKRKSSSYSIEEARRRDAYPNGRYYLKANSDNKRIRTSPPTPAPTTYKMDTWQKNHHDTQDQPTTDTNNSFSMQYHSMKQNPKVKQNALHTYITYMIYNDMTHGNSRKQQTPTTYHNNTTTTTATTTTTPSSSVYNNNLKYQQPPPPSLPLVQQRSDFYSTSQPPPPPPPPLSSSSSSAATSSTLRELSHSSTSPWPRHDDRSILSRPLTAFLWNNENSSVNSLDNNNRKEMMILPPLSSNPRPSPSISTYDRLPPV